MSGHRARASVVVSNRTGKTGDAILYGPIFAHILRFHPVVLLPTQVLVHGSTASISYRGFVVPRVKAKRPSRVFMRFTVPASALSIGVTATHTVQTSGSTAPRNASCTLNP
ncbi:MAG: hypothetical protein ACRDFX_00640 [Chloroflexota bacterium]